MYKEYLERIEKSKSSIKKRIELEKVELGIVDDLQAGRNKAVKEFNKIFDSKKNIFSSLNEVKKQAQKSLKEWSDLAADFTKAQKAAKELGVDLPKDIKKLGKEILDNSKIAKNQISKVETAKKQLSGF